MAKVFTVAAAAAGLLGLSVLSACGGGSGLNGVTSANNPGLTTVPAGHRPNAPALSGTTLDGKKLSLSQFRGHIVVVNVWGSWCSHCREEGPALEETYQKYQSKGVDFLGLNVMDDNPTALAYVTSANVTYPSLQDRDELLMLQFGSIVPTVGVPSTVIIDQQGKIAARAIGEVTEPELEQQLDALLVAG